MHELEEHAVRIAMHDAGDRAERIIADRVGALGRLGLKLRRIGDELARDRIGRIGAIDQFGHRRRDRDRIARRHLRQCLDLARRHQTGIAQLRNAAQGSGRHQPLRRSWPRQRGHRSYRLDRAACEGMPASQQCPDYAASAAVVSRQERYIGKMMSARRARPTKANRPLAIMPAAVPPQARPINISSSPRPQLSRRR